MESPPCNIVMLAAEAVPYVKVGGLGDVVGALPKYLGKLGARPAVLIPAYKDISHERYGIRPYDPVRGFDVPMGQGRAHAEIFHTVLPGTEIDVFLIGCLRYFYRDGIYDDPKSKEGFADNLERYIFFVKAALELLPRLGRPVDIIHCHDSQTAFAPGLLRFGLQGNSFYSRAGSLFTIHNLAYQGIYPKEALYWANLGYRLHYPGSAFEFWGKVNSMKIGIECADLVNTVSETYALEIQSSPEHGHGLEGVLRSRQTDLVGIVNGVDYHDWNPATDPLIPVHYSVRNPSGKTLCRAELLKQCGFAPEQDGTPLVGMVSRLASQKGLDLVAEAMEELAHLDLKLVILGQGQQRYQDLLTHFARRHPQKVAVRIAFDNRLAHQIYAGCDLFLMPSRYEPCGLNQLIALRYGAIPVVRATGGLADTVKDYDFATGRGTGFRFVQYSAKEMLSAIRRALSLYSDRPRWLALVRRAMWQNWSWEESAKKYMILYDRIRQKRNPGMKRSTHG